MIQAHPREILYIRFTFCNLSWCFCINALHDPTTSSLAKGTDVFDTNVFSVQIREIK